MEEKIKLSGREQDIMNVLWESDGPLIAKDIADKDPSLSINTVQSVLKGLLRRNFIKIADIVYSGTVLTRSYEPILTADEYMVNQIKKGISTRRITPEGIMAALLKKERNEAEIIDKLEAILNEHRRKIKES